MGLFHGLIKDSPATFAINKGMKVRGNMRKRRRKANAAKRQHERQYPPSTEYRTPREEWRSAGYKIVVASFFLPIGGYWIGALGLAILGLAIISLTKIR